MNKQNGVFVVWMSTPNGNVLLYATYDYWKQYAKWNKPGKKPHNV